MHSLLLHEACKECISAAWVKASEGYSTQAGYEGLYWLFHGITKAHKDSYCLTSHSVNSAMFTGKSVILCAHPV